MKALRSRSPCGERGLKFFARATSHARPRSLPVRGAWIEITSGVCRLMVLPSLPVRGAWIEMSCVAVILYFPVVAPRAGSVD